MARVSKLIILILVGVGVIWFANFYWKNLRGIGPVIKSPPEDITDASFNTTGLPLNLPPGFSISIFAKDLPGARVMVLDSNGNMWVSQTKEGTISHLTLKDSKVVNQRTVLKGLNNPHGLAFDPEFSSILYYAEEHQISYIDIESAAKPVKVVDLPSGGGHFTRTIRFGPDDRLYVSIGSSCNVCIEKDARRAAIYSMNKDGSDFKLHASGLRNAVFFDWSYVDGRMWATEMGRDFLGDDLPPDEINVIGSPSTSSGQNSAPNFGWPYCYGKNIPDPFGQGQSCADKSASYIDLQAHSAPLGLAFVPEEGWPEEYWYDLLVAYHGSWNRSEPTGYKIVRIKLDSKGNYEGMDSTGSPQVDDFITGWLTKEGALGRPVDILIQSGGTIYISDDKAGVIYKLTYQGKI